jgi:hypothetical protein
MTSTSSAPLSDLMDDFAIAAMAQLIHIYSPEDMGDKADMVKWCEAIASTSYVLASAMMNARSTLHKVMVEDLQSKEPDEA